MWHEILRAVPVYLSSILKFILGPMGGYFEGLHIVTTIIATVGGMMTAVVCFTYFGKYLREKLLKRFFKTPKVNAKKSEKWDKVYSKYGLAGIAFLTPLILTPIGGTLLAVGFGSPKEKIILYMLISGIFWGIALTFTIYFFGHSALPEFIK